MHLAPPATLTTDLSEIIENQIPDADGNIIPSDVREVTPTGSLAAEVVPTSAARKSAHASDSRRAKKELAGVAAGAGIAVLAANVLGWLWGV